MTRMFKIAVACLTLFLLSSTLWTSAAQTDLAAIIEVLEGSVEVQRVNTEQWIAIRLEAIVGVGDHIRTTSNGSARITFFADGIETTLLPNSEMRINRFSGSSQAFDLNVAVLVGQTIQRITRALDVSSSYIVETPGMTLAARGTAFSVRVEDNGRSAAIVADGTVAAEAQEVTKEVPAAYGIRASADQGLSDVVRAATFAELDAALDGCSVVISLPDDVSVNVRAAPRSDAARLGVIAPADLTLFVGVAEGGQWYRIPFAGGFGWVLSSTPAIDPTCAGLRRFPANVPAEGDAGNGQTTEGLDGKPGNLEQLSSAASDGG